MNMLILRELVTRGLGAARKVPGIVWVGLFVALLVIAAAVSLVHYGAARERKKAVRAEHEAAVVAATLRVQATSSHTDALIARADSTKPAAIAATKTRQTLRDRVVLVDSATVRIDGELTAAPPVLIALVAADDQKVLTDSVHTAPLEVLPVAVLEERAARTQRDTAVAHVNDDPPADSGGGHSALAIAGAVLGTVAGLFALLHH